MEGTDLFQNIRRNIVTEVLRECKNHRIKSKITAEFISYYIKLLELNPNRGLTTENLTNRENVQHFVKHLVEKFGNQQDPQIMTVRLQHEFLSQFGALENSVTTFRRKMDKRLYSLLLGIIQQSTHNSAEELYHKITYYVTLASGLGNPAQRPVYKEVIQVVKSVLTPDEMEVFPSLQYYIKEELIKCLVDIITGIRLYNHSCRKGGEGMDDLPQLMEDGIKIVQVKLENCIETAQRRARQLTNYVERHIHITRYKDDWIVETDINTPNQETKWRNRRDTAITYRQLVKSTRLLLGYVTNLDKNRKVLKAKFDDIIKTLNDNIIPTLYQAITEVFPHFTDLAKIWKDFQDDAIRLRETAAIFQRQAQSIFAIEVVDSELEQQSYLENWVDFHDEPLLESVSNTDITIIHAEDARRFTKQDLEFNGYCPWILTHTDGALVPGIIKFGVIEYKKKLYAFYSRMAANSFTRKPDEYIMKTIEVAREKVHLIKFLNLENLMKEHVHIKVLVQKPVKPIKSINSVEVQTDTHFQDSYINYEYFWNIWDYKRAVTKYRDLTNKRTTATETNKTHQKESHHTQTFSLTDCFSQTKKDNYANTKRPLNYFYGLRGIKKNYPFVMNLEQAQSFSQVPRNFLK